MKKLLIAVLGVFLFANLSYAKTLVKYHKNTGEILQTNTVDEMPSDEIINDRFKTDTTDIILVDGDVDITKQRVDLGKKKIKDIPRAELDSKEQARAQKKAKETQDKDNAKAKLKVLGLTDDELAALFKGE